LCLGSTVAVIVPDDSFRRSLCFLLEAEGHVALPLTVANGALDQGGIDCIVIDEKAMPIDTRSLAHGLPIVMLVDRTESHPPDGAIRLVEKPILGTALIEAVQGSICASRCPELGLPGSR
jgi:FixJ family two-component response regulator